MKKGNNIEFNFEILSIDELQQINGGNSIFFAPLDCEFRHLDSASRDFCANLRRYRLY